ncbi:MAG: monovalent cation/H(+) antiporter subunit G [Bradymonadaceae bacterium]
MIDIPAALFIAAGAVFFLAGTVGILRFPDVFVRLHGLTKADNLGLGFMALGLAIHWFSWVPALKLLLVWALVLVASTTSCHLIAGTALRRGLKPWERP